MTRRGFALLTVLWLITALSAVVGLSLAATRLGQRTTLNRVALTRGHWAAEACLAIVQARWVQHKLADTATIVLGRWTWCGWHVVDPTARINVNTADREVLERLAAGGDSSLVTTDGPGTVNVSAAAPRVLLALPGMSPEAVDRLLARRAVGRPLTSLDELSGLLSPSAREVLLARYADLARIATFSAPQLVVTAQGWVREQGARSSALRSTIENLVVPLPERLAVIRRRMW